MLRLLELLQIRYIAWGRMKVQMVTGIASICLFILAAKVIFIGK